MVCEHALHPSRKSRQPLNLITLLFGIPALESEPCCEQFNCLLVCIRVLTWLPKSLVLFCKMMFHNFSFSGFTSLLAVFTASQCTTSDLCRRFPIFRHDGNCIKTRSSLRCGSIGHTVTPSTLCRAGTNLIDTS